MISNNTVKKVLCRIFIISVSGLPLISCKMGPLTGLDVFTIESPRSISFGLTQWNNIDMFHTLGKETDKSSFAFYLYGTEAADPWLFEEEMVDPSDLSNFKESVTKDPDFMHTFYGPNLLRAGIVSEVKVFSDKMLFGKTPGTDLSDHVVLQEINTRNMILASFPRFEYIGKAEIGMNIRDYLHVGFSMQRQLGKIPIASFVFDAIPQDMPDDFCITLEIPLSLNFIVDDEESNHVFKTTTQIHFDR